jgi:iron(III) transport system substrate-binding protein
MLRRNVLGGLAASAALARDAAAQDSEWQKVVDAARKEGKLVIYTASIGSPFHKTVFKAFEAKYGIAIELLEARASEVRERVRVEQTAGRFLGDIHHNGSTTTWLMTRDGNLQPHGGIPNVKNIVPPFGPTSPHPAEVISYGLLVKPQHGETRRRTQGLAGHPRSKSGPARSCPTTIARWRRCRVLRGHAEHLRQRVPREAGGAKAGVLARHRQQRASRGAQRVSALTSFSLQDTNNLKGLPVKAIVPAEAGLCPLRPDDAQNAPHPNAARVFANHYLEPERQLVFANAGYNR